MHSCKGATELDQQEYQVPPKCNSGVCTQTALSDLMTQGRYELVMECIHLPRWERTVMPFHVAAILAYPANRWQRLTTDDAVSLRRLVITGTSPFSDGVVVEGMLWRSTQ